MAPMNCWNLRVTAEVNQGGRKYMEDVTSVQFERVKSGKVVVEYAAFAIYDGHGGKDAAHFARDNLLETVKQQKGFYSNNESTVKKAISDAFVITHHAMWNKLHEWPKTPLGHPSTAGTTASLVIIRGNRMYVANVGDSMIVMGSRDVCDKPSQQPKAYTASGLTIDHKPELVKERKRIEKCGGCVMNKSGVNRVVWARPKLNHNGPIRRSTKLDKIPFLAVARSLGDLWSFNSELNEFVVSPVPDVYAYNLHPGKEQFIVLASDGLWNMVRPQECVSAVADIEDRRKNNEGKSSPAHKLVQLALDRWAMRMMRADNTSVIVVIIERRKIEPSKGKGTYFESWTSSKSETTASDIEEFETTADNSKEKDKPIKVSLPSSGSSTENQVEKPAPPPIEPLQDASISSSNGDVSDGVMAKTSKENNKKDVTEEPSSSGIQEARVTRSQTVENNKSSAKRKSSFKTPIRGVKTRRMSLSSNIKKRPRSDGGATLAKSPGLRARRLRAAKRSL